MEFSILDIFDRQNLEIANPWYLYIKIKNKYNHNCNYSLINAEFSLLTHFNLLLIRNQLLK